MPQITYISLKVARTEPRAEPETHLQTPWSQWSAWLWWHHTSLLTSMELPGLFHTQLVVKPPGPHHVVMLLLTWAQINNLSLFDISLAETASCFLTVESFIEPESSNQPLPCPPSTENSELTGSFSPKVIPVPPHRTDEDSSTCFLYAPVHEMTYFASQIIYFF